MRIASSCKSAIQGCIAPLRGPPVNSPTPDSFTSGENIPPTMNQVVPPQSILRTGYSTTFCRSGPMSIRRDTCSRPRHPTFHVNDGSRTPNKSRAHSSAQQSLVRRHQRRAIIRPVEPTVMPVKNPSTGLRLPTVIPNTVSVKQAVKKREKKSKKRGESRFLRQVTTNRQSSL